MSASGSGGAATTTSASIRDGVATATPLSPPCGGGDSPSVVVVPEWKRELLERRKNLASAKTTASSPPITTTNTTGHSHSQRSREQSTSPVSASAAAVVAGDRRSGGGALSSATDSIRSHTATPAIGTTTATVTSNGTSTVVSAGTSFDQVASSVVAFSKTAAASIKSASKSDSRGELVATRIHSGGVEDSSPPVEPQSKLQSPRNNNHHNSNCAADNNQKRNTDEAAALDGEQQPSVRSPPPPPSSSSLSSPAAILSVTGRGVLLAKNKPESTTLPLSPRSSSSSGKIPPSKDKATESRFTSKMVAQEVCESAAMDAALAIGGSVVMGQCSSPDGGGVPTDPRCDYETAEELKYGPGIVQKLRSRFMSYTMRLNAAKNQRPSLQNMRRATSLNNLLDDDEDSTRTASPVHSTNGGGGGERHGGRDHGDLRMKETHEELILHRHSMGTTNGFGQKDVVTKASAAGGDGDLQCDGLKKYQNEMMRSRQLRRGNESLKRARSVETLRYDSKMWERDVQMTNSNNKLMEVIMHEQPQQQQPPQPLSKDSVTVEDRIVNARERGDPRPTRLKPFIDVTERPPPDLVKTTLMKFEATANRKGRAPTSRNGEVAAKVAILEKPSILHPKPPLSPKKPVIKPRTSIQTPSPLITAKQQHQQQALRSPSPLLISVDMTYKQSTPAVTSERRNGTNLLSSPPQTPPDLINSIHGAVVRKEGANNHHHLQQIIQQQNGGGGFESPITQLTNKLKSMQLQSPVVVVGGGGVKSARLIDNGGGMVSAHRPSDSLSNSSASTATSSATSSPVPHSAASGSYYLNGCGSSVGGRLELGDVSAEDCYEYRHYDEEVEGGVDDNEEEEEKQEEKLGSAVSESNEEEEEDDAEDEDDQVTVRRINKRELENISQAGTTQEFRFISSSSNQILHQAPKSHLPVVPPRTGGGGVKNKPPTASALNMRFVPSVGVGGVGATNKGVGKVVQEIVSLVSEDPNDDHGHGHETDVDECKTTTALLIQKIKEEARSKCSSGSQVNQVVVTNGGVVVHNSHSGLNHNHNSNGNGNGHTNNHSARNGNNSDTTTTSSRQREMEKNLINAGKTSGGGEIKEQQQQQPVATVAKKKSWQEEPQGNTMVFNFSQRKDVPDYIDSDGMILLPHRKRELPKPGESGFVVLGDLSLETSTDPDDASWTMGPPSPCNIHFENDNVIIEGKSNLRKQLNRSKQWSIRFDDSLTSTFEYVSESSFLETYDDEVDSSSDSQMSMHTGQKFMTISSAPLGSYMPMKGALASNFELGVTKSPSPGSTSVSMSPSPTQQSKEDDDQQQNRLIGNGGGDPESLQYLKPASDEETVAWSEGTRATDLLF